MTTMVTIREFCIRRYSISCAVSRRGDCSYELTATSNVAWFGSGSWKLEVGWVHAMQQSISMDTCSTAGCLHVGNAVVPVVIILLLRHDAVTCASAVTFPALTSPDREDQKTVLFLMRGRKRRCWHTVGCEDANTVNLALHFCAALNCTIVHYHWGTPEIEYFGCGLCPACSGRHSMWMINRWRTPDCQNC
jgi:hypothetical protein